MDKTNKNSWPISKRGFITALAFGTAALLVMVSDLLIPVYGEAIRIDPRELFVTLGSALTGPIGGMVIGFMAQSWFAGADWSFRTVSMIVHILGGVWMGISYKKLVHHKLKMPWLLLGWIGLVIVYYYVMLFFFFVTGFLVLFPSLFDELFGGLSLGQAYIALLTAATPEFIATTIITTLIIIVLPPKYRRPLW